jgi:hypothetical protein
VGKTDRLAKRTGGQNGQVGKTDRWAKQTVGQNGQVGKTDRWAKRTDRLGPTSEPTITYRVRARAVRIACRPPNFSQGDLHHNFNTR